MARPATTAEAVEGLEAQLGYQFRDRGLLSQALTHRSHRGREGERWVEAKAALERCREIGGSAAATAQQQLEEVAKKLQQQGDTQSDPLEKQ